MSSSHSEAQQLRRSLKARHMYMIAIGGSIGTGLFVASGATVANAGPGGALLAYALIGFMVFLLMQSLGEMATYIPLAGSFGEYARRFVSPSFGFAIGWNYWYNWAITVAAELAADGHRYVRISFCGDTKELGAAMDILAANYLKSTSIRPDLFNTEEHS